MPKRPRGVRPRPPRSSSVRRFAGHCWGVFKRSPWTSAAAAMTIFVSLSALGFYSYIDAVAEPWYYVSHGMFRYELGARDSKWKLVGDTTSAILRDLQIDGAEGKLAATKNNIAKWQLELSKAQDGTVTKELILKSLTEENQTKDKLNAQLQTLRKIRGETR